MIYKWCFYFLKLLPHRPEPYRYKEYTEIIMGHMANELHKEKFDVDEFCKEISWLLTTEESKNTLNQKLDELREKEKGLKDKLGII